MNLTKLINTAWMHSCRAGARRFQRSTRRVKATQFELLRQTLAANQVSQYGQRHRFHTIESYRDFCHHVPLVSYQQLAADVERIASGETNILTVEPVRLLEPTSGTSSAEKLIPYTRGLQRQFQRGLAAWIHDLYSKRPAIRRGRAYWSISPALDRRRMSEGGIPIGFDDDTQYLGFAQRHLAGRILAVPASVARSESVDQFQYQTLLHLLAAEDLTLLSVWSPTFLTTLLAKLSAWQEELLAELREQENVPRRRVAKVQAVLQSGNALPDVCQQLWPQLAVVSCWADASAALFVPQLKSLLPQAELQPKGLLATEAFVSLPLIDQAGAALALRSHFFEFEDVDASESDPHRLLRLAHEVDVGGRYRVVVTTMGGLNRYQLGDEIEVVGFLNECPLIRFLGRGHHTSDLVGEKLHASHVRDVIQRVLARHAITATFAMLAPDEADSDEADTVEAYTDEATTVEADPREASPFRYCLFLECDEPLAANRWQERLAEDLERGLQENPYYYHAVQMGQLASAAIYVIDGAEPAASIYQRERVRRGQRLGNIKPMAIDPWCGWRQIFTEKSPALSS